jgi:hypothetical protein
MNIAALFLHNMQESSPGWAIWDHEKKLTEEEVARIDAVFRKHVSKEEFGGFNTWMISVFDSVDDIAVKRFTWDHFDWHGTLAEIEEKLDNYYNRYAVPPENE